MGVKKAGVFGSLCKLVSISVFFAFLCGSNPARPEDKEESGHKITLLEAVTRTLENQPNILMQQQEVELAGGRLQQAEGQFDTVLGTSVGHDHEELPLSESEKLSLGISKEVTDATTYQLDLTRQFRTGITLMPSVSIVRTDGFVPTVGVSSQVFNQSQVSFLVSIPMLKGRGVEATAAQEMASKSDYEAGKMTMRHILSSSARDTIIAYWNCLAAQKNLREFEESESRARKMLDDTKTLIEHDELPRAELTQVQANLEDKTVARIAGEQKLFEATQALGLAMGLTRDGLASAPSPADDFPVPPAEKVSRVEREAGSLTEISLQRREDYHAARQRQESAKILLVAARNNLLPKLNLDLKAGYSGLKDNSGVLRFFSSLGDEIPGANASFLLRYEWPIENNSARGLMAQRLASQREAVIRVKDTERRIASDTLTALSALKRSSEELVRAQSSVRFYESAVLNEKKKFQHGMSTLLDVIIVEDRSTSAHLNEIQSRLNVAAAVAQLRFVTGTLMNAQEDMISVGLQELTTIPLP